MNKRQSAADRDMRYLAKAWRHGYAGPPETPVGPNIWSQIPQQPRGPTYVMDEERVNDLYRRWARVGKRDRFCAAVLVLVYRDNYSTDGYPFTERQLYDALDRYSWS